MGVGTLLSFLIVLQQVGEDVAVLQALVDIGVLVIEILGLLMQQPVVVTKMSPILQASSIVITS